MSKLLAIAFLMTTVGSARAEDDRSEGVATGLAIAGTLTGPALLATALRVEEHHPILGDTLAIGAAAASVFGPSLGNWYAGTFWSRGLAVRLVGAAGVGAGLALVVTSSGPRLFADDHADSRYEGGALLFFTGLGAMGVGAGLDVLDSHVHVVPTPRGISIAGAF